MKTGIINNQFRLLCLMAVLALMLAGQTRAQTLVINELSDTVLSYSLTGGPAGGAFAEVTTSVPGGWAFGFPASLLLSIQLR